MQEHCDGQLKSASPTRFNPDESEGLDMFQVAPPESSIPTPYIVIDTKTNEAVKDQLEDLGLDNNTIEADYVAAGKKSLKRMNASGSTAQVSLNQVHLRYEAFKKFVDPEGMLNQELLLNLWVKHDPQVGRKKGNKRRKKQPRKNNSLASDINDEPGKIDPRTCSKIVVSIAKTAKGLEKVVARIHCWNMHVPLWMHCLKINAPSDVTIPMQTLFNEGSVSQTNPLQPGKFVVVIRKKIYAYKNGHHEWQTMASSCDQICYLALMVYYYDPGAVMLTSYQHGVPH
ncbi:hypothetical protein DFH28DRAFT_922989 [Melampsora americana]|nr:hypothetical protein DFH28DRAFT_922989 [Melampsora americana]